VADDTRPAAPAVAISSRPRMRGGNWLAVRSGGSKSTPSGEGPRRCARPRGCGRERLTARSLPLSRDARAGWGRPDPYVEGRVNSHGSRSIANTGSFGCRRRNSSPSVDPTQHPYLVARSFHFAGRSCQLVKVSVYEEEAPRSPPHIYAKPERARPARARSPARGSRREAPRLASSRLLSNA
jgi:hypothetical protein